MRHEQEYMREQSATPPYKGGRAVFFFFVKMKRARESKFWPIFVFFRA